MRLAVVELIRRPFLVALTEEKWCVLNRGMEVLQILDEFESESTFHLASIAERFTAYLIDIIVLVALLMGGESLLSSLILWQGSLDPVIILVFSDILSITGFILYFGLQEGLGGATIGKKALGIKVVAVNGNPIDLKKGLIRGAARLLSGVVLLMGYIMAFFNERKQTLHDSMAGTIVIRA